MARALVVVTGCSGGLGASSLAAALARAWSGRAGERPEVVLVDGHLGRGGLDVTCGIEHLVGVRWSQLAAVVGPVDPVRLVERLPTAHGCAVLSADGASGGVPAQARRDVLASLDAGDSTLVVDGPLPSGSPVRPTLEVLLTGVQPRALADLDAVLGGVGRENCRSASGGGRQGTGAGERVIVTAGADPPSALVEALSRHTALPVVGHLRHRPAVARAAERGEWPGGAAFAEVVRAIAHRLPEVRAA